MKKGHLNLWLFCMILFIGKTTYAQQVMMQGWYWDYPKTVSGNSWADTLRLKAASLAQAGITDIWFPPHAVASSGPGSNGYDPQDLFIGNTTTGLGTRAALNNMLSTFTAQGIHPVADVIFNHRDGGKPEVNPPVKEYITNQYTAVKEPFPSDRFRCILPIGGNTGNGAGDYYFKISSKSQASRFYNYGYKVFMWTNKKGNQNLPDQNETEPNGGGDCGQANNTLQLGRNMVASVDAIGCKTDEFKLHLSTTDFNAAGDTLYITLTNTGDYSDHRIYGIWCSTCNADIVNKLLYQTYTDFTHLPSGRGQMNYNNFKPNSTNVNTTYLSGDWDKMYFYYDYDQFQQRTNDTLINYAKWNWTDLGVRGFRMDAVKHFTPTFVSNLLNSIHAAGMDPSIAVGEVYSTNTADLSNWVNAVSSGMTPGALAAIRPKIFDFSLRENLRKACDDNAFDTRNVFLGSAHDAAGMSGFNVVTFINNHDFRDGSGGASLVRNNPVLAYAYILTNNQLGLPTIFYPDYYSYPTGAAYGYLPTGLPNIKSNLNELMYVLKTYINGSPQSFYLNRFSTPYSSTYTSGTADKALIYQLRGAATGGNRDVLVAINFGSTPLKVRQQLDADNGNVVTGNVFNKVAGSAVEASQTVDINKQVYINLPAKSYAVWVRNAGATSSVTCSEFIATPTANDKVLTDWQMLGDKDASMYEVQRKTEADVDYMTIGKITPQWIDGKASYSFPDQKPVWNEAMLYRLKITGQDNQVSYSDIQLVRINKVETSVKIKGNPVRENLELMVTSGNEERIGFSILDAAGQPVKTHVAILTNGTQSVTIGMSGVAAGHYILLAKSPSFQKSIPFIKQ